MNIVLRFAAACVLIGADIILLTYLILRGDWQHLASWASVLALTMVVVIICISLPAIIAPLTQWRHHAAARAAQEHDYTRAPADMYEVEPGYALPWGESLQIRRTLDTGYYFMLLLTVPAGTLLFCTLSLLALLQLLMPSSLTLLPSSLATLMQHLSPIRWLVLAMPIVILFVAYGTTILDTLMQHDMCLQADDQGITFHQSMRQTVSLRWDEIHYCIFWPSRRLFALTIPYNGTFHLGNSRQHIDFKTQFWSMTFSETQHHTSTYIYQDGWKTYFENTLHLLATITARNSVTIQVPSDLLTRTIHTQ